MARCGPAIWELAASFSSPKFTGSLTTCLPLMTAEAVSLASLLFSAVGAGASASAVIVPYAVVWPA